MSTLLLISETIESFVHLKIISTEKTFVLACIHQLYSLVSTRLPQTEWRRLKLVDHSEIRRKTHKTYSSVQAIIETIIENYNVVYSLTNSVFTIVLLCPWKITIGLVLTYLSFFLFYVRRRSLDLFALRIKNNAKYGELNAKYGRVVGRTLDYVLHRERNKLISNSGSLRIAFEDLYYTSEYAANRFLFVKELLRKLYTSIIISVLLSHASNPFLIVPNYHCLSSFVS